MEALYECEIAWDPDDPEPYDHGKDYIQLHRNVGEVVMSTLAIACATTEGLDVVGDHRSRELHRYLIERDVGALYDAWLHPSDAPTNPTGATDKEIFEFVIASSCDLSKLDAAAIRSLQEEREPLQALLESMRKHAEDIPPMDPGPWRDQALRDATAKVLNDWRQDRLNLSNFAREFFGVGLIDQGESAAKAILEKALSSSAAGLSSGWLLGTGSGLAIGILAHGIKTYSDVRMHARSSATHYLTSLEKAGVCFRVAQE